jgi:hypothetical protein
MARMISPRKISRGGLRSRYPPCAPRRLSTKRAVFRSRRINSRNFCGMSSAAAMLEIFVDSG